MLQPFKLSLNASNKSLYEVCSLSKEYSFACAVLNDGDIILQFMCISRSIIPGNR
jgi:hypothetical protein